jgi:hypothetical protein
MIVNKQTDEQTSTIGTLVKINIYTVDSVLRGHLRDTEKVNL